MSDGCRRVRWRASLPLLLLLTLGPLLPAPVGASEQGARDRVDALLAELQARGTNVTVHKRGSAELKAGDVATYVVDLKANTPYYFVAFGDETAPDVDIMVADEAGNPLASDEKPNQYAMVKVTPPQTGRYMFLVGNAGRTPGWFHMAVMY